MFKKNGILWLTTHGIWPYHPTPGDYHRWTLDGLKNIISNKFKIIETNSFLGGPAYAFFIYLRIFWSITRKVNHLQITVFNKFSKNNIWGKSEPRNIRIKGKPYLYIGNIIFYIVAVPVNIIMTIIDKFTPKSIRNAESAVFRIHAQKKYENKEGFIL